MRVWGDDPSSVRVSVRRKGEARPGDGTWVRAGGLKLEAGGECEAEAV